MDKLEKVLKVRQQAEKASAQVLAERQQARVQAQAQQKQLDELTAEYRNQHAQIRQSGAHHFIQFQKFYAHLKVAVHAQEDVVQKLVDAEHLETENYIHRHKERRALETLLQKRDAQHKIMQSRRERRAQTTSTRDPLV